MGEELEKDAAREGDQRPAVTLRETPSLAIKSGSAQRNPSEGQGVGVKGDGWTDVGLVPSFGGEETLDKWLGWKRGKDFDVEDGGLVLKSSAKL
jgi:alpha-methylacyl-CoA racemase